MSWEYLSKEAALKFSEMNNCIPKEAVERIIQELGLKSKTRHEEASMAGCSEMFDSLLDVGCGPGDVTKQFIPYFKSVTGIDSSPFQIEQAKSKNAAAKVAYLVGKGEELPVANKSVDLAIFIFSAFHMDTRKVEVELNRVLKPNGLAVFYSYYIVGIDLVKKGSDVSVHPESAPEAVCLWDSCLKTFENYAIQNNHPSKGHYDKYKEICQGMNILNQRIVEDVETFTFLTLHDFLIPYEEGIACFRNAIEGLGFSPIKSFAKSLKNLWEIPLVDDKDIDLKITYSSFMVFLDR